MTRRADEIKLFASLRGLVVPAEYHFDQDFPEFAGNPTIETLIRAYQTEDEIEDMLKVSPPYNPQDCELPPLKRIMKLGNLRHFYQTVERSVAFAMDFDDMLRWGYQERNPMNPNYIRTIHKGFTEFDAENYDPTGTTPVGIVLIGFGGHGKTVTLNRILLKRYPQVYIHSKYGDRKFTRSQIVWIKLDCPEDGTRKGLLVSLCLTLDDLLGTKYFDTIANRGSANIQTMMPQIANALVNHHVGCLIIDEFQNFHGSHEGTLAIRFLRRLNNDLKIPLVFVGTPDASGVLAGQFSVTRRASGYGNLEWRQMRAGTLPNDPGDWDVFWAALIRYKYIKGQFSLALSSTFHRLTGGCPDIAVKMMIACQKRAIRGNIDKQGAEDVDAELAKRVAKEEFPWLKDAIDALNENTPQSLRRYHDLYFRNMTNTSPKHAVINTSQPSSDSVKTNNVNENNLPANGQITGVNEGVNSTPKLGRNRIPARRHPHLQNSSNSPTLCDTVDTGKKLEPPRSAYQSLVDAGYIASPSDYY